MSNIVNELQSVVMNNQDAAAIDADTELTFSRLWSLTDRFAGGLRSHDIEPGDRVGICLNEPAKLLVAVFGTLRNGCVPVVFSPELFDSEVADGLDEVDAPALLIDDRSPVSLISLSSSMRFILTVDIEGYFGMTYEAFLDNSGINSDGARTGIDLVERAEDDTALIAYGKHEGEVTTHRYTHTHLRKATTGDDHQPRTGQHRHLDCVQPIHPVACVYEAIATLLNGSCYVHLGEWDPEAVHASLLDDAVDDVSVTPKQCTDLESFGYDPQEDPITVVQPVFQPLRSNHDPAPDLDADTVVRPLSDG